MLIVQKFGGTSLADSSCIRAAAERIVNTVRSGNRVLAVVSARGHTTDRLVADARELTACPSGREMDACLAAGEQTAAGLMAMAIRELGCPAVSLTGWQAGILTDDTYGNARILALQNQRIRRELDAEKVVVVAGFQGVNEVGDITTLGRGGSDTTAVALAAFLKAELCQIYTDVDGVYQKDPRKFPDAKKYDRISYENMLALVREGAQVLHDRSVELGCRYGIPIQVLSAFTEDAGTLVTDMAE